MVTSIKVSPTPAARPPAMDPAKNQSNRNVIKPKVHLTEKYQTELKKYRTLLSLDGGGLRGLITAQVLIELEDAIKRVIYDNRKVLLQEPELVEAGADSFDVDLGDWFDQLAGTSTGGLLALYFAARGGAKGKSYDGNRAGSARNASLLYRKEGKRIFGTSSTWKGIYRVTSGGQYCHTADGLEGVLQDIFGDECLSTLQSSAVVTTVDVDNARTGIFFCKNSNAEWNKPQPTTAPADGTSSGASRASNFRMKFQASNGHKVDTVMDQKTWGFACPLRRSHGTKVLVQAAEGMKTKEAADSRTVADMYLPGMALTDPDQAVKGINEHGWWLPPLEMKTGLDFRLWEVARTTSAAPCFLPPVQVAPVRCSVDSDPAAWPKDEEDKEGRRLKKVQFIDGGLANNDPTWMGLAMMLMADNRINNEDPEVSKVASISNTAILSIGTGTAATCLAYQPGGQGTVPLMNIFDLLGPLIGLTMSMNGEDKENILNMLYYGLLRAPRGQYLRIQLKQTDTRLAPEVGHTSSGGAAGASATVTPVDNSSATDSRRKQPAKGGHAVATVDGEDCRELTDFDVASLDKMDDPDEEVLKAYERIGINLAQRYKEYLERFVKFYVFNLEDPYKNRMPDKVTI